jgi:hypothetical protein
MEHRLTTSLLISALRKRAEQSGGTCTVINRGDADAGGLLLICAEKGCISALLELAYNPAGEMIWRHCLPQIIDEQQKFENYLMKRRKTDGDLWVIELDIPAAERFAADFVAID